MLKALLKSRFERWLTRRIPASNDITLNQKRIFIFPSRFGAYFLAVLSLILIAAINYENNLIYLLFFLSLSLLNTAILFTFQNISGLQLKSARAEPVFAGDAAQFTITVCAHKKPHYRISLGWPKQDEPMFSEFDLEAFSQANTAVYCQTQQRGMFTPGRLLVESHYPLGFIRCWSWLDIDSHCIVYPKPIALNPLPETNVMGDGETLSQHRGSDDFYGFRAYQPGDSLKQVDWRGYAKSQNLQTKVYQAHSDDSHWVDWFAIDTADTELKLSQLCDWVLQLAANHKIYGLRLPNVEITPSQGDVHKHQVLTALALYGVSDV